MKKLKINTKPLSARARKRYEKHMAEWNRKMKPVVDAIKDSKRLTAADYQKRINV